MSDAIRSALVRSFGLFGELLESYTGKLSECKNEKIVLDVIDLMGKEYKGKKTPSMFEIRDRYFKVFKTENQTCYCGVYCYKTNRLVPAGAKVLPCADMVKVSIANPQENKNNLWNEETALHYTYACLDAWEEANGFESKKNPKAAAEIEDALMDWKESKCRISIAARRPPIQYPKDWSESQDIYENTAIPF